MSTSSVANGVRIVFQDPGKGKPLVLVHGSWSSHHNWDAAVPALAEHYRVISYDRRGHSESERVAGRHLRRRRRRPSGTHRPGGAGPASGSGRCRPPRGPWQVTGSLPQ